MTIPLGNTLCVAGIIYLVHTRSLISWLTAITGMCLLWYFFQDYVLQQFPIIAPIMHALCSDNVLVYNTIMSVYMHSILCAYIIYLSI